MAATAVQTQEVAATASKTEPAGEQAQPVPGLATPTSVASSKSENLMPQEPQEMPAKAEEDEAQAKFAKVEQAENVPVPVEEKVPLKPVPMEVTEAKAEAAVHWSLLMVGLLKVGISATLNLSKKAEAFVEPDDGKVEVEVEVEVDWDAEEEDYTAPQLAKNEEPFEEVAATAPDRAAPSKRQRVHQPRINLPYEVLVDIERDVCRACNVRATAQHLETPEHMSALRRFHAEYVADPQKAIEKYKAQGQGVVAAAAAAEDVPPWLDVPGGQAAPITPPLDRDAEAFNVPAPVTPPARTMDPDAKAFKPPRAQQPQPPAKAPRTPLMDRVGVNLQAGKHEAYFVVASGTHLAVPYRVAVTAKQTAWAVILPGTDGKGVTDTLSVHFEQLKLGVIVPEAIMTSNAPKKKPGRAPRPTGLGGFSKVWLKQPGKRSTWWVSAAAPGGPQPCVETRPATPRSRSPTSLGRSTAGRWMRCCNSKGCLYGP